MVAEWSPDSWKGKRAGQQVVYDDPEALSTVLDRLRRLPPIVTSWESEKLKQQLADAGRGERFLLQGGDCAERFEDCRPGVIDAKLKIMLAMSAVLIYGGGRQVVRVGRIAGQYAKPRSSPDETIGGVTLPAYRGDLVNRPEFTAEARRPDPNRLLEGYSRAAMTINFIRSLLAGGFGDVHHPHVWDLSFVEHAEHSEQYREIVDAIVNAVRFLEAMVGRRLDELARVDFFTSHEALHLDYEQAVSEIPPLRSRWYNVGTHFPWIGERTRQVDGAHVEYLRGVANPVGVKVGPNIAADELIELIDRLNPEGEPGRLTLIHRMGAGGVRRRLPALLDAVRRSERVVTWVCDPMHGNTFKTADGTKTRRFEDILAELDASFEVHQAAGTVLGGVHFEMTGQDVTEVVGGARGLTEADLGRAYESDVDPRLNYEQALEMAFLIARRMRRR